MKKYTFKKVISLKINIENNLFFSCLLNQFDDIQDHTRRLTEMTKEGIDEDNAEAYIDWHNYLKDLLEDKRFAKYIPKHYYDYLYENEYYQAKEILEEMAKEWQREIDGLNRWYYSTRL